MNLTKMKFKKLLLGVAGLMTLAACSSDEPLSNEQTTVPGEEEYTNKYVSVSLEMPAGTRADGDVFDDGTKNESKIDNIVFFFFNDNDICSDIQMIESPSFNDPATPSQNPAISNYGTIEVRLKSGVVYSKVAVALNTTAADANTLKSQIKNIEDLEKRNMNYANNINQTSSSAFGTGQTMSNSLYYDMDNSATAPEADKKVTVVTIDKDKHIYTSAQRPNIDNLILNGTKKYVDIYVERVAARVDVSKAEFDMSKYYVYKENGNEVKTITLYDHVNLKKEDIYVRPFIKGTILNVLSRRANLIKNIDINEVGYGNGATGYKNFQWNDPANKRSYWAQTPLNSNNTLTYFSWNQAEDKGIDAFTQYINPNTRDYEPIANNEGNSDNTKVMVVAELWQVDESGNKLGDKPLDFVRYGADYMLVGSLKSHVANLTNVAVRNIDWDNAGLTLDGNALTEAQLTNVKKAVANAFNEGLGGSMFDVVILNDEKPNEPEGADWEAKVIKSAALAYTINGIADNALLTQVKQKIDATVDFSLENVNQEAILYWKNGKTYYYTNIQHKGFVGLAGNSNNDFLYGVVRNHIYKVNLTGVFGLGTPVIDPAKPIDPDRPQDERPSYIRARINILPWRMVTQDAIIH